MATLTIWERAGDSAYVGVGEVAAFFRVDRRVVRKWIDAGVLPACRLPGRGDLRIRADEVERFAASMRMGPRRG
jgi:excisionase family DNA binding protein